MEEHLTDCKMNTGFHCWFFHLRFGFFYYKALDCFELELRHLVVDKTKPSKMYVFRFHLIIGNSPKATQLLTHPSSLSRIILTNNT
jgi:hypothetical protein